MEIRGFLLLGVCVSSTLFAETLRNVLERNHIPKTTFTAKELDTNVSSGAEQSEGDMQYIAYPTLSADGTLSGPIHVVSYGGYATKVIHAELSGDQISDVCEGSILGIKAVAHRVLIETHINPSALCTLVLDPQLRYLATYMGWAIGDLGWGRALFREDQIHFASVHPLRLAIVNLDKNESTEVYPPKGDRIGMEYSKELEKNKPSEQWCNERAAYCDSDVFDSDVADGPATDKELMNFNILLRFDADSYGENAAAKVGSWFVLYVFRRDLRGWNYCNRRLNDNELHHLEDEGGLGGNNWHEWADTCSKTKPVAIQESDLSLWDDSHGKR